MPGAILQLFQEQEDLPETLIELTYSNKHGYFAIETASTGAYTLRISGLGYEAKDQPIRLSDSEKFVVYNIPMTPTDDEATSRIVGQITDENQEIIPLAEVILYSVTDYGGMIPMGYQKTDENGYYEFNHVPKGTYKVSLIVS